jgi:hypothetical protein
MKCINDSDIKILKEKGFKEMPNGFWHIDNNGIEMIMIPLIDGWKLEMYEWYRSKEGNWYKDFDKVYSFNGQSLEELIQLWGK